jgi:SagB-type dehydrogenase family enzyme
MGTRDELVRLVDLLSDYEREHLFRAVSQVAAAERFWEGDFGHLYNEYVKVRYFNLDRDRLLAPSPEHDAFVPMALVKAFPDAERVGLPPPGRLEASVSEAMLGRRSRREYSAASLPLRQLATVLHHAAGVTGTASAYGLSRLPLRTFPSHGGLQSPEAYLAVRAVVGLPTGLYHYRALDHELHRLDRLDHSDYLREITFGEEFVARAAVVLLFTGYYERLRWKYGERAYRFMCIDVGFLGQNVYLAAEAAGVSACAVSGFAQDAVEELLRVDGKDEIALLLIALGLPDHAQVPGEAADP